MTRGTARRAPPALSVGPPGPRALGVAVLRVGQHIHNGRAPGSQGRSNGPTNVTGLLCPSPKAVKSLGDFAKILRAEGERFCRHLTGIVHIAAPFHAETLVVDDDVHHWEVVSYGCLELHNVIAKPPVTRDADDPFLRRC